MKHLVLMLIVIASGCQSIRMAQNKQRVKKSFDQTLLSKHFTGFALYDPEAKEWLYKHNSDKYFTPASNVKILSLYAGTKLLGDSLPAIKYTYREDTLIFSGLGDPTFLHPDFAKHPAFDFLKSHPGPLVFSPNPISSYSYGPGWNWDDYPFDYQPERSQFPIYGNVVRVEASPNPGIKITPDFFEDNIVPTVVPNQELRYPDHNIFVVNTTRKSDRLIPFRTYPELTSSLLIDTLSRKVTIDEKTFFGHVLYSQSTDHLLAIMMKRSDNFFAEQLLLMCSSTLSDSLNAEKVIGYVISRYLRDLPDQPIWVDGSGLSRYNLITPRSQVRLLEKLRVEKGEEWLFDIFPVGGVSGTIKDWYPGVTKPYVYAKTGTLRNNHNLSGYLKTKTGKTLIFSFMNNNYTTTSGQVKQQIQNILEIIRDGY